MWHEDGFDSVLNCVHGKLSFSVFRQSSVPGGLGAFVAESLER